MQPDYMLRNQQTKVEIEDIIQEQKKDTMILHYHRDL